MSSQTAEIQSLFFYYKMLIPHFRENIKNYKEKKYLQHKTGNCSSNPEKLLQIEAEGLEIANFLRSLEQFV